MSALYEELTRLWADRPDRAWALAERALRDDDFRVRVLAHRALADLTAVLPPGGWTPAHEQLAERLKLPSARATWSPGEVWFPAVNGASGKLVKVTVRWRSDGRDSLPARHARLAPSLEAARRVLNDASLGFEASFLPEEGWDGDSAGLAVGLAAVSAVRAKLNLSLVVATGALNAAGDVVQVGQVDDKRRLCQEAAPRATLLIPRGAAVGQAHGVLPVSTLSVALDALGHCDDPNEPLSAARRLDEEGRSEEAAQRAELLLADPRYSADQLASLLNICLAGANHGADAARQARFAAALAASLEELDGGALAQAIGNLAVRAIDTLNPEAADEVLALAPPSSVKPRHRVHLLGPKALLCTLRGEHGAALDLREQALKLAPVEERPRALGDLADALMRADRAEDALACAKEALHLAQVTTHRAGYQLRTTSFLRLHLARALALVGANAEALTALDPLRRLSGLDPALRGRLLCVELRGDLAGAQQLHERFGASGGLLRALTLRTLARLGDADAARALLALPVFAERAGLTVDEAARRLPY